METVSAFLVNLMKMTFSIVIVPPNEMNLCLFVSCVYKVSTGIQMDLKAVCSKNNMVGQQMHNTEVEPMWVKMPRV